MGGCLSLAHRGGKMDLREIPSAVGGDMSMRHGIILAKSIPAKKYNIKTGETILEAKRIDEAFIDMTTTCHLFGTPEEVAEQIKNRIRDELGFTVNVGISQNKLLA